MALQRQILKKSLGEAKAKLCNYQNTLPFFFSTAPSSSADADADDRLPQLPPFDHAPRPYNGPRADQVFQKRKKFLGPSLFHYYQKPVSISFSFCFLKYLKMTVVSDSFCLIFFYSHSLLPFLKSCYTQMPIFGKFNTASIVKIKSCKKIFFSFFIKKISQNSS